ncbi:cytochrome P450 [Micromonospora sp. NPDC048868]|uniref:cytochrome P450 n=1 Tax=Micromonospora sp. NPDC048868 TaxID=3364258 RepID=UPI003718FB82
MGVERRVGQRPAVTHQRRPPGLFACRPAQNVRQGLRSLPFAGHCSSGVPPDRWGHEGIRGRSSHRHIRSRHVTGGQLGRPSVRRHRGVRPVAVRKPRSGGMETMSATVVDLDDLDLFVCGDPHAIWARLRREAPVHWNAGPDGTGHWALTRYADVAAAYVDPVTFSSRHGTVLGGSYRSATDTASGQMLICSDPPEHRLLRQQVHPAFGQQMMTKAAGYVRSYLTAALDRFVQAGGGDFATEVAPQLPAGLLTAMLGIGREDAFHLLGLTRRMIGFRDDEYASRSGGPMTLVAAQAEIFEFLGDLVVHRRRNPGNDLISILLQARINGRALTEDQILYNALNVAVGGDETTPFTASAIVEALASHPVQARRLRDDPGLNRTAVEEFFRWTSTNAYVRRTATRDVDVRGVTIRAGDTVTLWNASANRDPDAFPSPDRLDLGRSPNQHLAFGVAHHRCIGMGAARMEIAMLTEEIARRGLRFEVSGPVRRLRSNFMLGITHLPVTVTLFGQSPGLRQPP